MALSYQSAVCLVVAASNTAWRMSHTTWVSATANYIELLHLHTQDAFNTLFRCCKGDVTMMQSRATVVFRSASDHCPVLLVHVCCYALQNNNSCYCNLTGIENALYYSNKATGALSSAVAGAFVMWVGCSFMLMSAVGDFARTRRERELLLRAQRQAAEATAASLAAGTAPGYMTYAPGQDTLPLLKMQQLQQQQQQLQV